MEVLAGLCSVTLRALPADEVLTLAAANGLGAIEWGGDVHVPAGDLTTATKVGSWSADAGVTSASYGSYLQAGDLTADAVEQVLDTAEALGAPNVRIWCRYGDGPDAADDQRQRIADDVAVVAGAAAARGLTVSLEFHPDTLTETAASTRRLLSDVGADNLFTYWQPVPGADPDHLAAELATVADDLSHVHVFAWRADTSRRPLADADDWWPALLAEARRPGRWPGRRVALLEFVRDDDPGQLAADAACLRRWLATAAR